MNIRDQWGVRQYGTENGGQSVIPKRSPLVSQIPNAVLPQRRLVGGLNGGFNPNSSFFSYDDGSANPLRKPQQKFQTVSNWWNNPILRNRVIYNPRQPQQNTFQPYVVQPGMPPVLDKQQIINHVNNTFGNEGGLAMAVLRGENVNLNPSQKQIGGGQARGLWQFEPRTWKYMGGNVNDMNDPMVATEMAKKLRDKRGWGQWSAYNNGSYKKFLK